jgi:hypothetical protein
MAAVMKVNKKLIARICKLLEMVARDGIEPPTPAFSGPLCQRRNMFRIRATAGFKDA